MLAFRELIAFTKRHSVPVALFDHLADQPNRTLNQRRAVNGLEANFITGDPATFADMAGWLPTIGEEVDAPASAGQCNIEQASLFRAGEGFRPGNNQIEKFIVLNAAVDPIVAFAHIAQDCVVRFAPFGATEGKPPSRQASCPGLAVPNRPKAVASRSGTS